MKELNKKQWRTIAFWTFLLGIISLVCTLIDYAYGENLYAFNLLIIAALSIITGFVPYWTSTNNPEKGELIRPDENYRELAEFDPLVQWIERNDHKLSRKLYIVLLNRFYIDTFYSKIASGTVKLSQILHTKVELGILDAFNYQLANCVENFCEKVRRTHTGVLGLYMFAIIFAAALLFVALALFGGIT